MLIFTRVNLSLPTSGRCKSFIIMIRKLTLVFLLFIGFQSIAHAQGRDSATVFIQPYTDTSCLGTQLTFNVVQTSDTFVTTPVVFHWYVDNLLQTVAIDTFTTTALLEGDSVYCTIVFVNSLGTLDSFRSNAIIVHHAASIPPNVIISITSGSNPDCSGHPLTFTAYPINGGTNPLYQWMVNGVALVGEDSISINRYFGGADTVSCMMVSNSSCAPFDTVVSAGVPIIHTHLTESISISTLYPIVCQGRPDTFIANAIDYGTSASYQWYLDSVAVTGAIGPMFITDTLKNGDSVFCVITSNDTCVLNPVTQSNILYMTVLHTFGTYASIGITAGNNPGCLDSPVTFTALYDTFGVAPYLAWYVNGVGPLSVGSSTFTSTFNNLDTVNFKIVATDGGCYSHDSIITPPEIMVRDPHPVTPLISLIGTQLVSNSTGTYTWYGPDGLIPGATGPVYHPLVLGYYYAIKDSSNCNSDTSNIIYISLLGINDINKSDVRIYPNPTSGLLNVDLGTLSADMKLDVYNIMGQSIKHAEISKQSSHSTLDLSGYPDGNYYVVLKDQEGYSATYKLVLTHN